MLAIRHNHYYEIVDGREVCIDDEIPFFIPDLWMFCRLKDIFEFIDYRGYTPNKTTEGVVLVTASNIKEGYFESTPVVYISESEYLERNSRGITVKGDLLFTTEAPLGHCCINPFDKCSCGQRIITLSPIIREKIDVRYILHYILSSFFQSYLFKMKSGVTVAGIKAARLKNMLVPIPPLIEQFRISAKLNDLIKCFKQLEQTQKKLNTMESDLKNLLKKSILLYAIMGKLEDQNPDDKPVEIKCKNPIIRRDNSYYETIRGKEVCIDDEIKYPVPNNWVLVRGKDIILENIGGGTPSKNISNYWNGSIKWASVRDLQSNRLFVTERTITQDGLDNSSSNIVPKGSIIICIRVGLGKIAICDDDIAINQDLRGLILSDQILPDYFIIFYQFIDIEGSGTTVKV